MKNKPRRIFKAFIASAADCDELRKASVDAILEVNKTIASKNAAIEYYLWEENKRAGFAGKGTGKEYQKEIFKEFGKNCDIFIIFFWTKLGAGTLEEYKFFQDTWLKKNKKILFLGCHYGKLISHETLESHRTYYDLIDFLKINDKDWMPLGRAKRAIKNKTDFAKELRTELHTYLGNLSATSKNP